MQTQIETSALEIEAVKIKYHNEMHLAVSNVSFAVKHGSITAIIGPNGSGKTSLIKAILGLIPYEGKIKIYGKDIKYQYDLLGFVPQRYTFDEQFPVTVEEFVKMPTFNLPPDKCSKLDDILADVGAHKLKHKLLSEISGGQLQRILLARALIKRPLLLVLDEPEAGVDVAGEQTFYDLLEHLVKNRNMTVLVASHELDVVYTYADQVVCINRNMICEGRPREVLNQKTFEELYGRELKFYGHEHGTKNRSLK
jgi:ABC-type Mn2+/Zn2+ transport system ATPase subunit